MKVLKWLYTKITKKEPPYYYNYSIFKIVLKPIRKWIVNVVAANSPFNCVRIFLYRLCGIKIGKNTFIGMRCYIDDMCHDLITIGNNVVISYGVFIACHGHRQVHLPIKICDDAYIGMRANIISKNANAGEQNLKTMGVTVGERAVVGACALVNRDVPPYATAVGVPCRIIEKDKIK